MDYTPGAMFSMQPEVYSSRRPNSGSIGTRAYQLALFVIFESGVQMLADNPTLYYKNQECTDFIAQVPVTWDETMDEALARARALARPGDAVLLAPATSSYDQFKNYIERGNHFRALVTSMRNA